MRSWKLHWDYQLYKALEHQYQLGLERLNEHLPEIKVELTFRYVPLVTLSTQTALIFSDVRTCRQQVLQFRPPLEEIRSKFYREIRRFVCIPLHFRGVDITMATDTIFPKMIEQNVKCLQTVYRKVCWFQLCLAAVTYQFCFLRRSCSFNVCLMPWTCSKTGLSWEQLMLMDWLIKTALHWKTLKGTLNQ